jgi:hypothetical protein
MNADKYGSEAESWKSKQDKSFLDQRLPRPCAADCLFSCLTSTLLNPGLHTQKVPGTNDHAGQTTGGTERYGSALCATPDNVQLLRCRSLNPGLLLFAAITKLQHA